MTRYTRGRAFEWRIRKYYEQHDFLVTRSAGSKGKADLVAVRKWDSSGAHTECLNCRRPEVLLIQCKIRASRKPFLNLEISGEKIVSMPKEARELKALAESVGARAIWAIRKGHRGMELIEL